MTTRSSFGSHLNSAFTRARGQLSTAKWRANRARNWLGQNARSGTGQHPFGEAKRGDGLLFEDTHGRRTEPLAHPAPMHGHLVPGTESPGKPQAFPE